jgi:GGDEF domain-containing protein
LTKLAPARIRYATGLFGPVFFRHLAISVTRTVAGPGEPRGSGMTESHENCGSGHALRAAECDGAEALVADTLIRLCERLTVTLGIWEANIYEYVRERDCLIAEAIWSRRLEQRDIDWIGAENQINRHRGIERVFTDHEVVVVHAEDERDSTPEAERMDSWGEKTALYAPLELDGEVLGLLELVERRRRREFSGDELTFILTLADVAAIAVSNARSSRRQARRSQRLVNLLDLSRTLSSSLQADDVIEGVRSRLGSLFPQRLSGIEIVQPKYTPRDPARPAHEPDALDPLVARALTMRLPAQELSGDHQRLVVPLITQGRAEGWMNILGELPRAFDEDEIELVQILANQTAAALDNTRLYETLARQAITDGLTGLFNHRFFYERLRDEVVRATRYDLPVSLLMMDLDDFKLYNDRHGHPAGDTVLRRVAEVIQAQLRAADVPARYGGEEFAVILPHTATGAQDEPRAPAGGAGPEAHDGARSEGAAAAAERVRRSIQDTIFAGADALHGEHVTISVGIANLPAHARTADELVDAADRALYLAKRHGKNRVEICG